MHKLWEKLETAAFSPRLLQIGWPPGPIWKESLLKWLPKGHSPQISQGGEVEMSVWTHCWALFLKAFFWCFLKWHFWDFGCHSGAFGLLFWFTLRCFFLAFSYLGTFSKIELPCRRQLENQGPGVTEMAQKSSTNCSWLWACFGKPYFKETMQLLWKTGSQREPKLEPKLDLGGGKLNHFTHGSSRLPKWCPKVPKVAPRVAKGCQNRTKMLPKLAKSGTKAIPKGGLSSKVYNIHIYMCIHHII